MQLKTFKFPKLELKIVQDIQAQGYEAYFVGGCIRDILLSINPHDFDITTNMPYNEMESFFTSNGYSFHTGGKKFLTAFINGVEVSQYRKDYDIDGTRAGTKVESVSDIREDLKRRDFTINSMAYDAVSSNFVDPYGGLKDLSEGILRFVGNPYNRLFADSLRFLRGLRFCCKYKFKFDDDSFNAMMSNAVKRHFIKTVPFESIKNEIIKVFSNCDNLWDFFNPLIANKLLFYIFPSLSVVNNLPGGRFHSETVLEHCIYCCENISKKFPLLRIAGLLHDVGKGPAAKIVKGKGITFYGHDKLGSDLVKSDLLRLKLSHTEINYIYNLIKYHMRMWTPDMSKKSYRKLNAKFKDKKIYYPCFLRLRIADNNANLKNSPIELNRIKNMLLKLEHIQSDEEYNPNKLKINGQDLINIGITPGPQFGEIFQKLKTAIINEELKNNKDEILEWVIKFHQL